MGNLVDRKGKKSNDTCSTLIKAVSSSSIFHFAAAQFKQRPIRIIGVQRLSSHPAAARF